MKESLFLIFQFEDFFPKANDFIIPSIFFLVMGRIEFENRTYEFTWSSIILLAVGGPLLSLWIYYSNDYVWLQGITAQITIWSLNLITGMQNQAVYSSFGNYWYLLIQNTASPSQYLEPIEFETFCTGIQAIAIFVGVIVFIPHSIAKETSKDIWPRKIKAIVAISILFYIVNIIRMWIQLYLYHIGYSWDSVHYPISAASSFIAIVAVLLIHKYVPEFIMSLIWIGNEIRHLIKRNTVSTTDSPQDTENEKKEDSKKESEINSTISEPDLGV